jgi:hypothetical protein
MGNPKQQQLRGKKFTRPSENRKNSHQRAPIAEEHWLTHYWRPAMAWSYMAICLFDFIIAPTGSAMLITFYQSTIPVWKSLTLENGGIIHVAFGAILGVAAWGRTKESVINTETSAGFGPGFGGQSYNESTYTREEYQVGQPRRVQQPNNPGGDPPIVPYKPPVTNNVQNEELYDTMRGEGTDVPIYTESEIRPRPVR